MHVRIKRVDKSLPLPEYKTTGSVAFDLYARESMVIASQTVARIPTNLVIETPPGFMLAVTLRSSTPKRKGLIIPHGLGIIDQDFCGESDELLLQVYNFLSTETVVERGERIGQAVFIPIEQARWNEVDGMGVPNRGGFGSTGTHE